MNRNEKALIHKDINEIISSKRVIIPMTMVPIVLIVIIPLAILIVRTLLEMIQVCLQRWLLL